MDAFDTSLMYRNSISKSYDYSNVSVFICDPHTNMCSDIRAAFLGYGFKQVHQFYSIKKMIQALEEKEWVDLIVCDADMDNGQAIEMFLKIRNRELSANPFINIVMLAWGVTFDRAALVLSCGIDDFMSKPISPDKLFRRVNSLIKNRKPFVVNSEYIGPVRSNNLDYTNKLPAINDSFIFVDENKTFDVPNTFAERVSGSDGSNFRQMIDSVWYDIVSERQKHNANHFFSLMQSLLVRLRRMKVTRDVIHNINMLLHVCSDAMIRFEYMNNTEGCKNINSIIESLNQIRYSTSDRVDPEIAASLKRLTAFVRDAFSKIEY